MILDTIVADKAMRLKEHKKRRNEEEMKKLALSKPGEGGRFLRALSKPGLSIIGEFKKASPSLGVISDELALSERIEQYNASADAISCLTEEDHFHGGIEYFEEIRKISPLPMLRKDFIIDSYQIYEAKAIGADAVLLITAILEQEKLKGFYKLAESLGMDCLVEVHDEAEMERALDAKAAIIGVNNRNLKDFTISLETTRCLSSYIPEGTVLVSESGVRCREDIVFLKDCHVDALLIGRAFMESDNPQRLAENWKGVYNNASS